MLASRFCNALRAVLARFRFLVAKDLRATNATDMSTMLPISSAMKCGSFCGVVGVCSAVEDKLNVVNKFCHFDGCDSDTDERCGNEFGDC